MSVPSINILFISDKQQAWTKEVSTHLYSYKDAIKFNYAYLENLTSLSLNSLNKLNPQIIIVDLDVSNDKFEKIFSDFKQIKYNQPPIIIGLFKECLHEKTVFFINNGFDAIFQKCTKNDETIFLTRFIIDNFKNSALTKGLYTLARVKKNISIDNFVTFTKLSLGSISFESTCNFDAKHLININNSFISKFNWDGSTNQIKGKFLKTNSPFNSFAYDYSIFPISKEEESIEIEEIKKTIQEDLSDEAKEILIADELSKKQSQILLEKKHNLQNFYRKYKHDFLIEKKINVLSISNNIELKLQSNNFELFKLYKQTHLYPNNLISKMQPKIIFYEIEELPDELDVKTQTIDKAKDKPFIYNHIKSLYELLQMNFYSQNPSKIVIFNKDPSLSEKDVMKEINSHSENYLWIDSEINDFSLNNTLKDLIKTNNNLLEEELIKNEKKSEILYINNTKDSFGFITHSGSLDAITEAEVIITTDQELPEGKSIFINYPIPMFIHIIPDIKFKPTHKLKLKTYRGIIMGINATQRDELRAFVITYNADNLKAS